MYSTLVVRRYTTKRYTQHITLTLQELSSPNPNSVNLKPPSQPDLMIMTHKLMEGSTD